MRYRKTAEYKARHAAYMREYRQRNLEKMRAIDKKYYEGHKHVHRAYQRAHPEKIKLWNLKQKHGLTKEEYIGLLTAHDNKCAICSTPLFYLSRLTHIDHDHETGEIRGILCHHCNTGIGLLRENPELLAKAAAYLARRVR